MSHETLLPCDAPACRFCHLKEGRLVQQGDPVGGGGAAAANAPGEEDWSAELDFQPRVSLVPPQSRFTRSGRVPRPPGTRGSRLRPVINIATGLIEWVNPDILALDQLQAAAHRYYNPQLPKRSHR